MPPTTTSVNWELFAVWAGAIANLIVALVALFGPMFWRQWHRARFDAAFDHASPYVISAPIRVQRPDHGGAVLTESEYPSFRVRMAIFNKGRGTAHDVEVYAYKLEKYQPNGSTRIVDTFLPGNLCWSDTNGPILTQLVPRANRLTDVFHIVKPDHRAELSYENASHLEAGKTAASIDKHTKAFGNDHLLPPGKYRLSFTITARDAETSYDSISFNLLGDWYNNLDDMLLKGLRA